ncbi:DUF3109 family protein [Bacteroidota bacterium]
MMIIDETLISDNLKMIRFFCNLKECYGACCVEGDAGAPLEENEIAYLEDHIDLIKPFMSENGKQLIDRTGVFDYDSTGAYVTTLIDEKECVFTKFDNNQVATCAIEKAFEAKKINFQKPISCHLYPLRINMVNGHEAINYHKWYICEKALSCGKQKEVYLYQFLKEALVRRYGEDWYESLRKLIEEKKYPQGL